MLSKLIKKFYVFAGSSFFSECEKPDIQCVLSNNCLLFIH